LSRPDIRGLPIALLVALMLGFLGTLPALAPLDGLGVDSLFWLRHQVYGPRHGPDQSPAVVIALDEETFRRPPFKSLPKVLWTPQLAQVINAVRAGGAKVIGQDLILPTSVEGFLPGYDRDYLLALRAGGEAGAIVLGQVQHTAKPISPFPGHSFAIGHGKNIRLVNLFRDSDGVIRRLPLAFQRRLADGQTHLEASMALELAQRASGKTLVLDPGMPKALGDLVLAPEDENALLIDFDTGGRGIPVYSLADLQACAAAGDTAFFEQAFAGKVVLLGSALDVEDRKLTSMRFVTGPEGAWFAQRCVHPVSQDIYAGAIVRDTIPASFIFAHAVNNLLRGALLREPGTRDVFLAVTLAALLAALAALTLRPLIGVAVVGLAGICWVGVSTWSFAHGLVLPLIDPLAAATAAFPILLGYRFGVTDRARRRIRRAFAYYLPEPVIERMERERTTPELGGETRDVTIFFSDLAGFTKVCEGLSPSEVVAIMNGYLTAVTDIIEAHGGFVDKYIGDAVLAVFGAPLDDPAHPRKAVLAALACQRAFVEIEPRLGLPPGRRLSARCGINSGPALIGNIGSKRRFNYTAMGDTVNLAARIESANKTYGSHLLISGETAERLGDDIAVVPVERVRVVGRDQPVVLYLPLGETEKLSAAERARLKAFGAAWERSEAHDVDGVAAVLAPLASDVPVAALLAARLRAAAAGPNDGPPVTDLTEK
jgi:class 3 adenylate cyclase